MTIPDLSVPGKTSLSEHGRQVSVGHLILRDLPGYPWLPCPICHGTESCDHTGKERAQAALPNLYLPDSREADRG